MTAASSAPAREGSAQQGSALRARLHQPKRAFIAAGELVAVVLLAWFAVYCWQRGLVRLSYQVIEGQPPVVSTRFQGNWLGTAAGSVTLAALLLLDAVRQVVLARRTRSWQALQADV